MTNPILNNIPMPVLNNVLANNPAMQIYNQVRNTQNPMAALQALANTNQQVQQAMNIVQQYQNNPQMAAIETAKICGVDITPFTNLLGIK